MRASSRRVFLSGRIGTVSLVLLLTALGTLTIPPNATASGHCAAAQPGPHAYQTSQCTLVVAGRLRSFLLSTPPPGAPPAPLVLAFHGLFQTASTFAAQTGLVPAARAAGLVLALPESRGPAFNDGRLGRSGPADDAFALAIVDQLAKARVADPRRVVVAGFSNGAGMAMAVASAHPRAIAALVSVDGSLIDAPGAPRPTGPVRAFLVHGTGDRVQPWGGRPGKGPLWPAYLPVPDTVAHWVRAAGGGTPAISRVRGRRDVEVSTWPVGRSGAAVVAYTVSGMGHEWPVAARDTLDATTLVTRVAAATDLGAERHVPGRTKPVTTGRALLSHR